VPTGLFLPVRVLSSLFRRLFLESLEKAFDAGKLQFFSTLEPLHKRPAFTRLLANLKKRDWVVYAKAPFAGPEQVLDYVGRYTHRVAISNNRLLDIESDKVRFKWKDYRGGDQVKTMTLTAGEFIRRFLLHVLPNGFQRIRYYGLLGNRHREEKLAACRHLLGMSQVEKNNADRSANVPNAGKATWWLSRSSRSGPPNLRKPWIPHDLQRRCRTRDERVLVVRHHRRIAHVSPIRPLRFADLGDNPGIGGHTISQKVPAPTFRAHMHLRRPPQPRGTDHSKPIGRTIVERFSPTRL
jgi:hypothetical protein